MPQLSAFANIFYGNAGNAISVNTVSFFPFNVFDSISLLTLNMPITVGSNNSVTFEFGLYSISGSSLFLTNTISGATSVGAALSRVYLSCTDVSSAQNITPGTWFFGLRVSASGGSSTNISYLRCANVAVSNAFPGGFIGGRMTDSTAALPASIATSDLDTTGTDAMTQPNIILSA